MPWSSEGLVPGWYTGSTMRWHTVQVTPSKSAGCDSAEPSVGSERPPSQPAGVWQRRQKSPAKAASWFAIVSVAWKTGSRIACAIMLPAQ